MGYCVTNLTFNSPVNFFLKSVNIWRSNRQWLIVSYAPFALHFCPQRCRSCQIRKITCIFRGEARVSCLGRGLEPRAWRAREREPITGVWGRSPQRGPGTEPVVRESGGRSPPEAENLLASRCATEAANLPHSPQFANFVNPRHS